MNAEDKRIDGRPGPSLLIGAAHRPGTPLKPSSPDSGCPVRECSGAIPYRMRNGVIEVLLITSRGSGRWIIPKGHLETGMSRAESAAREAFEEAGVVGTVEPESTGWYLHRKEWETQRVHVHLLAVESVLAQWPERLERHRLWSPLRYAAARVEHSGLREIILGLPGRLSQDQRPE